MSAKSKAALTTENTAVVTGQTTPESITPITLGQELQDIIDSFWNYTDDALTKPPMDITKAALAVLIGAQTIDDQRQYRITDRGDGNILIVYGRGIDNIQPHGIWIDTGTLKPQMVIMDYVNGYQGETNPFIAVFDKNRNLNLSQKIIIADGSQGADYILKSDANGKGTWTAPDPIPATYQSGIKQPAQTTGAGAMMGLAGAITPTKSGKVLIIISGEYTSNCISVPSNFNVTIGTGAAPANGSAVTFGSAYQHNERVVFDNTGKFSFSFNCIFNGLTIGTPYWIDMSIGNNCGAIMQLYNVSISAAEQL